MNLYETAKAKLLNEATVKAKEYLAWVKENHPQVEKLVKQAKWLEFSSFGVSSNTNNWHTLNTGEEFVEASVKDGVPLDGKDIMAFNKAGYNLEVVSDDDLVVALIIQKK